MDSNRSVVSVITTLWLYALTGVFGAPNPRPELSAMPPSAQKVRSSIVCEGQKAFVSCNNIYNQIHVVSTMFGRRDTTICVHPNIPSDTKCQEQEAQVKYQIEGLCDGESYCEVAANNNFMAKAGTTICPDVYKYLEIKYRCIPMTAYPISNEALESGQTVNEVITSPAGGTDSSASSAGSASSSPPCTRSSSSSSCSSVPVITDHEHSNVEPVTTVTSQATVTQIDTNKGTTTGGDITEEVSQGSDNTDVITETFPNTSTSSSTPPSSSEVNETFKKSNTPESPQESGDDVTLEGSASGLWEENEEQRDVVFDDRR